jgi:Uma2 family endonuclease
MMESAIEVRGQTMATATTRATLDDLYRVEGKAELIGGRIVHYMAAGDLPGQVAENIFVSLRLHTKSIGRGIAHADGVGFAVPEMPSGRESFSPDASCHFGQRPANPMRFIEGAPTFAVEVRSENDYGPSAEAEMAAKRDDYFAAGTQVVWDVDPEAETVTSYRAADPLHAAVFKRGDTADAEPAVPGWHIAVDEVFAR